MKKRFKTVFSTLVFAVCIIFVSLPVNAASTLPQYEIIYSKMEILEDGSCIVDEIQVLECDPAGNKATLATTTYQKSATRTYTYYDDAGRKCWSFTLKGTFQYDGSSSKATASSVSYSTYRNGWKCVSRSSSYSGNTVNGTASFNRLLTSININIGLRCSVSGTISNVDY